MKIINKYLLLVAKLILKSKLLQKILNVSAWKVYTYYSQPVINVCSNESLNKPTYFIHIPNTTTGI